MRYFLGVDLGGTKTHMLIADETGRALGFGEGGPGNHQDVGFDGMQKSLLTALEQALDSTHLQRKDISGTGFGIAGYDWPSEKPAMLASLNHLGIEAPFTLVNDSIPGLVAGAEAGWGINVVSGTGCNCRGWDESHQNEGRVTGYGIIMGEAAGSGELVYRAMQLVGHAWSKRGPHTSLCDIFIKYCGARDLDDLLEGYTEGRYQVGAETAPLVFQSAYAGDPVASELITWAGTELGEMANAVIRQLNFENLKFDVVLSGSMFEGGDLLINPMRRTIQNVAPGARLVRLKVPPVLGAVLIGMEAGKLPINHAIRATLESTVRMIMNGNSKSRVGMGV
ncbi:MAG TPA: BadF/BadG/BcrA/BcrD ATPase family protein [Anaerolineales bacterium]